MSGRRRGPALLRAIVTASSALAAQVALPGRIIRDWEQHRGVRWPVKLFAVCLVFVVVSISVLSERLPAWAEWLVVAFAACCVITITFLVPTIRNRR